MPDMPDIAGSAKMPADNTQKKPRRKALFRVKRVFAALLILSLLLAAVAGFVVQSGVGGDFLDDKVQAALQKKLGGFAKIDINNARLSLDDDYHLALKINNMPINPHDGNIDISPIGQLRFGFATMPLLRRKIEVVQIEADNAALTWHKSDSGKTLLASLPHDARQRVDFDALADMAFSMTEGLVEKADKVKINIFRFSNIHIRIQSPQETQNLTVKQFQLKRLRESVELQAKLIWLGQEIDITGSAALDFAGKVLNFSLHSANIPVRLGAADDAKPYLINGRPNNGFFRMRGLADVSLSGEETDSAGKRDKALLKGKKITAALNLKQAHSDISIDSAIPAALSMRASYLQGSGQIEIQDSSFALGGLELPFSGRFGYAENPDKNGLYAFAANSKDALSSPEDSPAEALPFDLDINGTARAQDSKINFSALTLQTEDAALFGQGSIRFGQQRWPEIVFVLHSSQMPVNEAKQLWPINISRPARAWVLAHIFGGDLKNLQMEMALPEGFYQKGKLPPLLTEKQLRISTNIDNTRSDLIGTLPPLREAYGKVTVKGTDTIIALDKALAYLPDGRVIHAADGAMSFVWHPGKPLWADLSVNMSGTVGAVGRLLACEPVNAAGKVSFNMQTAKGDISALLKMNFPLYRGVKQSRAEANSIAAGKSPRTVPMFKREVKWSAGIDFKNFTLAEPYRDSATIAAASGRAELDNRSAKINGNALINGIPATVSWVLPLAGAENAERKDQIAALIAPAESEAGIAASETAGNASLVPRQEKTIFHIDDSLRNRLFPGLENFLKGPINAEVGAEAAGRRPVRVDLTNAVLQLPWVGWRKGIGIPAGAALSLPAGPKGLKNIDIDDFTLSGANFRLAGRLHIRNGSFASAEFSQFSLNRTDRLALAVLRSDRIYHVKLSGASFDMRAFIKSLSNIVGHSGNMEGGLALTAAIDRVQGFYGENLRNFRAIYNRISANNDSAAISAVSTGGKPLLVQITKQRGRQEIKLQTEDAGAFLRFMNYYDKVQGGTLQSNLQSVGQNILSGPVTMHRFTILNEPELQALTSAQTNADGKKSSGSLMVDWAHGQLTKGPNYLALNKGVIHGPSVGATFQGTIYDSTGNIAMTGTYMPAYSLNRVFGDVPVLGMILGNGRDKGLIGITFKIEGKLKKPKVVVNPISAIAPGVLRSIFEFKPQ